MNVAGSGTVVGGDTWAVASISNFIAVPDVDIDQDAPLLEVNALVPLIEKGPVLSRLADFRTNGFPATAPTTNQ